MFWKSSNFAAPRTVYMLSLLMCTRHACHTCRDLDYCSKQRRRPAGTSQHAIIATYHRSVKKWNVFIDLELIIFPVQLGCYGYRSHCKVFCYWNMNVTLFSGISQSNFCIFHNTTESVIIYGKHIILRVLRMQMFCRSRFHSPIGVKPFQSLFMICGIKSSCAMLYVHMESN